MGAMGADDLAKRSVRCQSRANWRGHDAPADNEEVTP